MIRRIRAVGTRLSSLRVTAAVAFGVGSLAVTGVVGLPGRASAAYIGSEGRIAFVRNGDIYSINPSGNGLKLLAGGGHKAGPRWSPRGHRLAYLDHGNLWIMNADGSNKKQITSAAPRYTDGRPSWSPSGRYIAFVRTGRHAAHGYLIRYDTGSGQFKAFTTTFDFTQPPSRLPALPGTAVAWQRMANPTAFRYFLAMEGTGDLCPLNKYCLLGVAFDTESQFTNAFPTDEDVTSPPLRLTDPDWYPIKTQYATDILSTVEHCTPGGCVHSGIMLKITSSLILPGAYEAVYSPAGHRVAFVRNSVHGPRIYLVVPSSATSLLHPHLLTAGTEPDWQPTAPFPH